MIRLECYIEEKHVGTVMQRVAGLVKEPQWLPVINVEKKPNGKLAQATNGELVEMFRKWLSKQGVSTVNSVGGRAFLESIGQPAERVGYLMARAQEYGVIKRKPGGGKRNALYKVQKGE